MKDMGLALFYSRLIARSFSWKCCAGRTVLRANLIIYLPSVRDIATFKGFGSIREPVLAIA